MSQQPPPGLMLRSFLTIASSFVLVHILFAVIAYVLGLLFFPEYIAFTNLDEAAQKTMISQTPLLAIPRPMFWALVVLNGLSCFGVGWLVVKTAPFAQFPHAIFLAVLLFVTFLQLVVGDPSAKKWMDIIYMGVFPIAILLGAQFGMGPLLDSQDPEFDADDSQKSADPQ